MEVQVMKVLQVAICKISQLVKCRTLHERVFLDLTTFNRGRTLFSVKLSALSEFAMRFIFYSNVKKICF